MIVTERQMRVATHAKDAETFEPGESLEGSLTPPPSDVKALVSEAMANRPELKSAERNAEAQSQLADAARAARYPALSAFGDLIYANPNPRKFPLTDEFFPTWAVGAQVTWSPNDIVGGGASAREAEAKALALEARRAALRDAIEVEVTTAYQAVLQSDTAIKTTERQLQSATEGYRVARALYVNGRGTATTLIDAENALGQSRFDHLDARVAARIARARLEQAVGRVATPGR
jgi:outer membrane protein TolC